MDVTHSRYLLHTFRQSLGFGVFAIRICFAVSRTQKLDEDCFGIFGVSDSLVLDRSLQSIRMLRSEGRLCR